MYPIDNLKIEKAQASEYTKLCSVAFESFTDDFKLYGDRPVICQEDFWNSDDISGADIYSLFYKNEIIGGMIIFCLDKDSGDYRLGSIFILPKYQNIGLGTSVFDFVFKSYPDSKVWTLDTPYKSYRNHHFYEKLGFVKTGENVIHPGFILFDYRKDM